MAMSVLTAKYLTGERNEMESLQRVFEGAPGYSLNATGDLPGTTEAQALYTEIPPNKTYEDKFVIGYFHNGEMVGCADIVRGYPDDETAMLGLLLFTEKYQKKGLGKFAYSSLEDLCLSWSEVKKVRIGVLETNEHAFVFWKKLGFKENGEKKSWTQGKINCNVIVLEKNLPPQRR
jgi:RimJ/RimL family protein N-acetyltransferase